MSTDTTSSSSTTALVQRPPSSASHSQPTTQACAACKYQRRKCNPDCSLAPYFPADQQRQFLNAHRLFGVSNILKIVRGLDAHRRAEAMCSIIFQSNARAHDPVGGCYRIIQELEHQLQLFSAELAHVKEQLAFCRAQADPDPAMTSDVAIHPNFVVVNDTANDDAGYGNLTPDLHHHQTQPQPPQQYYNYLCFDGGGASDGNGNNHNNISNNISGGLDLEVPDLGFDLQEKCEGEEDVKPLMNMFEEMGCKDATAFHFSSKDEHKEEPNPMEYVQEHDLKGAASLFTLTNYNTSFV